MNTSLLRRYPRTLALLLLVTTGAALALPNFRLPLWDALLPFFEWMETTPFGVIGKTWGAAFAVVEAVHLLAMAVLGGAVLASDGRLLGVLLRDVPLQQVLEPCHRLWLSSLLVLVLTGVFMACGVALKIYYMDVYWYKMLALSIGVAFVFGVRRPLLRGDPAQLAPWVLRLLALASLLIWFSVAATGRWIGFSG